MSRRVNAVLALGTTDHVLPSPTPNALFCQKRNFPTLFRGNEIFQPLRFGNSVRYIQSFSVDWRRAVGMCSVIRWPTRSTDSFTPQQLLLLPNPLHQPAGTGGVQAVPPSQWAPLGSAAPQHCSHTDPRSRKANQRPPNTACTLPPTKGNKTICSAQKQLKKSLLIHIGHCSE
jgi:hypothetical protein